MVTGSVAPLDEVENAISCASLILEKNETTPCFVKSLSSTG